MSAKIGVLLANVGTPDELTIKSIRRYLSQFLWDERILDMHPFLRGLLIHGLILRTRPAKTLHAYRAIWTAQGSPLLVFSEQLKNQVQEHLGPDYVVELGMGVGSPSIPQALKKLSSLSKLVIVPLFPQYAAATTASVLSAVFRHLSKQWDIPQVTTIGPFYHEPEFIRLLSSKIQAHLKGHLLFSFHSLPVRHIEKSKCLGLKDKSCLIKGCPERAPEHCYRAQCFQTSTEIVKILGIHDYTVAFQSRLGSAQWIGPNLEEALANLARRGIKDLTVVCPSFVTDCLETLEEIGIRLRDTWMREHQGRSFHLVPCLNADEEWSQLLSSGL